MLNQLKNILMPPRFRTRSEVATVTVLSVEGGEKAALTLEVTSTPEVIAELNRELSTKMYSILGQAALGKE